MPRYVRHARKKGRAEMIAENLRRRPPAPQDPRAGYHVEQKGTWFRLVGPDGAAIGKAQRSEEDAWRLVP